MSSAERQLMLPEIVSMALLALALYPGARAVACRPDSPRLIRIFPPPGRVSN
jgi:hypothetical protein